MKKALKHYDPWTLEESKEFINLYLDGVKTRDVNLVCEQIADQFDRTFDAIKLRKQEVLGILTNKQRGIYNITDHMREAVEIIMNERGLSKQRMIMWFD